MKAMTIYWIAVFVITVSTGIFYYKIYNECKAKDGVLIRGQVSPICVSKDILK